MGTRHLPTIFPPSLSTILASAEKDSMHPGSFVNPLSLGIHTSCAQTEIQVRNRIRGYETGFAGKKPVSFSNVLAQLYDHIYESCAGNSSKKPVSFSHARQAGGTTG